MMAAGAAGNRLAAESGEEVHFHGGEMRNAGDHASV